MPHRPRLPLCAALFLLLSTTAFGDTFTGKVVGVADGDTISVLRDGKAVKVRLNGIDSPERGQAHGDKAKGFTGDLAFGKVVTVTYEKEDRYGRALGDVKLPGGKSLNQEIVRAGYAWHYKQYSKDVTLADLEAEAKKGKRGLWHDADPVPPWKFRRSKNQ